MSKSEGFNDKSPYIILNINKRRLLDFAKQGEEAQNKYVQEQKEKMIKAAMKFKNKENLDEIINQIEEAYSKIATSELREQYEQDIKRKDDDEKETEYKRKLEKKYGGHIADTGLIAEMYDSKTKNSLGKLIIRDEEKKPLICKYDDKDKRNLRVCLIATLHYKHVFSRSETVYEYLILRTIDDEDKANIIYSTCSLLNLEPKSPETKFIVNNLLSEESIDGSILNYGYIGGIEKDENGKFVLEIENQGNEAPFLDEDSFAAVVAWRQGLSAYETLEKLRKQNKSKNEKSEQVSNNSGNHGVQGDSDGR